ncbi:MAG: amidohydrolase family protein [Geminicoccaceae bacterium]|nr:amidohydrolase family protein [Geminicoccaceae bacterium]
MPDFPIIDTHVHLIDNSRVPLSWGEGTPWYGKPHLPADLDAARGPVEIEAFVFVEVAVRAGLHEQEAAFVADIATDEPRLQAIVAHAPMEHGAAVGSSLEKLAAHARVRGIRRLLQDETDPAFCLRPAFVEAIKLLPSFGLHFEICIYHPQMESVIELVRRCPEVTFMLDHIGKPRIEHRLREPWATRLTELATFENVTCKMSGLVTEADHGNWQPGDLRFYIDHVVETFGFERICFGSDWPVVTFAAPYARWVEVLDQTLSGTSESDLRKLYVDNARRFYRLGGSSGP